MPHSICYSGQSMAYLMGNLSSVDHSAFYSSTVLHTLKYYRRRSGLMH